MSRTIRRFASVAVAPLVLFGCAAQTIDYPTDVARGHIAARPGRPGVVVAAPHGSSDVQTGAIAAEVARRTGFGLVVVALVRVRVLNRAWLAKQRRYVVVIVLIIGAIITPQFMGVTSAFSPKRTSATRPLNKKAPDDAGDFFDFIDQQVGPAEAELDQDQDLSSVQSLPSKTRINKITITRPRPPPP